MSKGKSYNRIVFLTTLSVYLGLVLVGATPQVLTYAALTRNFDIQNEIEVKDDLDNKPDNEEIESFSRDDFPALFVGLLNEIKKAAADEKISLPIQTEFYVGGEFRRSQNSNDASISSTVSNPELSLIIQNAINRKFQTKAFELADYKGDTKTLKISLESNGADLSLSVSFTKLKAEQYAEFLNREFSSAAVSVENSLLKRVYENTKATAENDQVFIVTRLPRGSIDSLLK